VAGPVNLELNNREITRINVTSASEMHAACLKASAKANVIVMAAAVADYTPKAPSASKLKKSGKEVSIELVPTIDILAEMGRMKKKGQVIIGFALETDEEEANAKKKLEAKNLDMIVLNSLNDPGAGFKTVTNKVTVFLKTGKTIRIPLKSKQDISRDIVEVTSTLI
jgi:phosphopantothenoylcysteine decarboxylase/phosphopantothenate--cysteine ligase